MDDREDMQPFARAVEVICIVTSPFNAHGDKFTARVEQRQSYRSSARDVVDPPSVPRQTAERKYTRYVEFVIMVAAAAAAAEATAIPPTT